MVAEQGTMYSNLPSDRHIRLLWVSPESHHSKQISCSLQVVDFDSHPLFDCLSYTWKNPLGLPESSQEFQDEARNPLSEQILCDGQPLEVSRNLLKCLQFFRKKGFHVLSADGIVSSCSRPIWIDAICINQKNKREISKQIKMMSGIYAHAHQVLIWLGPRDEHSQRAASVVNRLASVAEGAHILQHCDLNRDDPCPRLGIEPSISLEEWYSYIALLQRAWFSRVWVAQESYFAKSIVVFCGETEIVWKNLVRSARLLQETGLAEALQEMSQSNSNIDENSVADDPSHLLDPEPNAPPIHSFSPLKSNLNNQFILTVFGGEGKKASFTLESLLSYARYLDASQAPDKVIGLIGIWQETAANKRLRDEITADFQASTSDVFMNATYAAMYESEDLNILRFVGLPPSTRSDPSITLPSWVPDYTRWPQLYDIDIPKSPSFADRNKNGATLSRGQARTLPQGPGAEGYGNWRADGGQAWHPINLERQSKCLTVKGTLFEAVADIGPFYRQVDNNEFYLLLKFFGESTSLSSPYDPDSSMAWLRTLVAGRYHGKPAGLEAVYAFHCLIAVFVKELEEGLEFYKLHDPEELPSGSDLERHLEETRGAIDDLSSSQANHNVIPTWEEVRRLIEVSLRDSHGDVERERMDSDTNAIRQSFNTAYRGRRIFRTTSNYWGISSESLEKGDQVCIISGADTPYVLRKSGTGWCVIGEAYVHGIMHGEAAHGPFDDLKLV
ncbi:heterokaryon incompatibility protein-domain-containing protein [Xylaria castorea]|nr:heterokaryon incompatibility protein-domain-containing protein [Xylaria castorea]